MDLQTFKERMEDLKIYSEWDFKGPFLCCVIESELGNEAFHTFLEIYCPWNGCCTWGARTFEGNALHSSEEAKAQRAFILLLFEQQCLQYKLYKDFKCLV